MVVLLAIFEFGIFITFCCPWWLKLVQKYKNEIHGPWDYDDAAECDGDNL